MDEKGLSPQELAVLNTFMDRHTVEEAAELLTIPYSTCSRYVRGLKKLGFLVETGFRENKKRYYVTVKSPQEISGTARPVNILWDGRLKPLEAALADFTPEQEIAIRSDVLAVLFWLKHRAEQKAGGETAGGPVPNDLVVILRRIQVKIRAWDRMIQEIINAAIWSDISDVAERLAGLGEITPSIKKKMHEFEIRYFADNKGPLEQ